MCQQEALHTSMQASHPEIFKCDVSCSGTKVFTLQGKEDLSTSPGSSAQSDSFVAELNCGRLFSDKLQKDDVTADQLSSQVLLILFFVYHFSAVKLKQ